MFKNILNGTIAHFHYKGGVGHLAFMMHRISGLGVLVFLSMHILLESTTHFAPHLYDRLNAGLHHPVALSAEIIMAFLVIFHGVNGFRIAYFDLFHVELWSKPSGTRSLLMIWVISFALWLPAFVLMVLHSLNLI